MKRLLPLVLLTLPALGQVPVSSPGSSPVSSPEARLGERAASDGPVRVERLLGAMGTTLAVRVVARDRATALEASETALRAIEATEARLSTWRPDTELQALNAAPTGVELSLSEATAADLARVDHWRRETGGAFDAAVGDLVQLYRLREGGRTPTEAELADAVELRSDGSALLLEGRTASKARPGLVLEEGGFAKGAALDAALRALAEPDEGAASNAAVESLALDFGGQVVVSGRGADYAFALADPRARDRGVLGYSIPRGSVATTGTSERGEHVIDPRTARPVGAGGVSITVWADSALDADCLSTGLFVLGADGALDFARRHDGVEVVALEPQPGGGLLARASAGWAGRLEVLTEDLTLELDGGGRSGSGAGLASTAAPVVAAAALAGTAAVDPAGALAQEGPLTPAAAGAQDADRIARLEARNQELERRIDLVAEEVQRFDLGGLAPPLGDREFGMGPGASKIYSVEEGVSIGGYGEAIFEDFESSRDDGSSGATDEADFLRAIIYVGYKFNERWLFNSEIEFEHASTGSSGSASVEFAYLEYAHSDALNARGGLVLMPMGLVNELHEPTTFPSAKRPGIETAIIPSTWRENGLGLLGELGEFEYRAYVVNGLEGAGFSAGGLRGGRQKGSQALAEDVAFVGRVDWTGVPGLTLGASAYHGDSAQDVSGVDLDTTLYEAHLDWGWRGLHLRALAAKAELDDVDGLNNALGLVGNASVGEELEGYYVELGYDVLGLFRPESEQSVMPFVRYETYDTQAEVPSGFSSDPANDVEIMTYGVVYKPHTQVVIKLDYMDVDNGAGSGQDQFNIALGYVF